MSDTLYCVLTKEDRSVTIDGLDLNVVTDVQMSFKSLDEIFESINYYKGKYDVAEVEKFRDQLVANGKAELTIHPYADCAFWWTVQAELLREGKYFL